MSRRRGTAGVFMAALLAAAAGVPALPADAAAQRVVREVQVPLDEERGIVEVDAELRRELGLFPGVEGFVAGRLFRTGDGGHVLELTLREGGRTVRERRALSPADLDALRGEVAAALERRGLSRAVTRSGRGGLVIAQTALGLGFYGWAVPAALDVESARGVVAAYLLTAGASFLVPYRLTRSITVTEAHRDAVVWGGTRGILYGLLLGDAFTLGDDDEFFAPSDPAAAPPGDDDGVILGMGIATSIAGSFLGYRLVDPARHDRGDVALWSTGGDFALAYGFATAVALGLYEGDEVCRGDVCETRDPESTVAGHLATVGLGAAGFHGARKWAEVEDYTVGDARALLSFGILGGQAVLPLAWAAFEDTGHGEKGFAASLMAGSAAGLWLGNRVLRGRSLTPSEGLLVQAGHVAGGLLAGGTTYLLDRGSSADELVYMATTAAGSAAGALLVFRALSTGGGEDAAGPAGPAEGVSFEVSAAGLWAPLLARDVRRRVRVPVLTIRH